MNVRRFQTKASISNLSKAIEFIKNIALEFKCPKSTLNELLIACEEIIVNIISYAYLPEHKDIIEICITNIPEGGLEIVFSDKGRPFDPLSVQPPDISSPIEERPIGGLGIFLVKNLMDDMRYSREQNMNVLTIRKKFPIETK